ncbi:MAG: glycoside hydrolase family 127 protein, partial [Lachnospiraceae bacterium]|nr:glycoside hydrolase family 127 protein [Lachnospiraceae bacterium]
MSKDYDLSQVLMKDSYCVNAFEKDVAYLLSLDEEKLLAGFYENAGIKTKKIRYAGWENMLIGGHTLGHYLTAAAQGYANAQVKKKDKDALFSKIKNIIDGLLECQKHSKGKPGFVFGAVIMDQ